MRESQCPKKEFKCTAFDNLAPSNLKEIPYIFSRKFSVRVEVIKLAAVIQI